jgi:acyl-CoA oxidase
MVGQLEEAFTSEEYPEEERRQLETKAAGVKALATWHATDTIQAAREACGGLGYLSAYRLGRLKADTDVFTTFEGDNTILLQLVAKSLLTEFRDEFGELSPVGTASFFAGQVVERIVERTAAREIVSRLWDDLTPGSEQEGDLADRKYQLALFAWREDHIVSAAARRLKGGIDAGSDPFDVFNECQDHILLAARAHVERLILEAFDRGVAGCADTGIREVLDRLCDLYALSRIEGDRAWFQEHGRISSTRSKAVIAAVNRLCSALRPHVGGLVEGFGVPEAALPETGSI